MYEQDFYDFSYGFRPKRSAHQALDSLWHRLMDVHGGWVLEADISSFSTPWITRSYGAFWTSGCATV